MIKKITSFNKVLKFVYQMGISWFLFRLKYELRKRGTYYSRKNQTILEKSEIEFSATFPHLHMGKVPTVKFKNIAEKELAGEVYAFSQQFFDYRGKWNYNPLSDRYIPKDIEWDKLPDFGESGDIKLVWEPSRFPQLYHFMAAFSLTNDPKYGIACRRQIMDWLVQNPFPYGPNYKCGQEIVFRLFAWFTGVNFFRAFFSENDLKVIKKNIYLSLLRIDINIDYAVKSVRNNHSISEAAGLFLGGLLFKDFPQAKGFVKKGLKYLLQETSYQVFQDGSYIQHSLNYQRLAMDVLSFVIYIAGESNFKLPDVLLAKHRKMYHFLYSFVQENGYLPNYGSNDGACLFPVSELDYRDYRPSLNFAAAVSENKSLFEEGQELIALFKVPLKGQGTISKQERFESGGYYLLRDHNKFCFIRCHSYKFRPAQNDMLHMDVWLDGLNIFCDSGSYSYNTTKEMKENFSGQKGHNTVMINDQNPMASVLNFGWSNWSKCQLKLHNKTTFIGETYGYLKSFGITHEREVIIYKEKIKVIDRLKNVKKKINIKQIWNSEYNFEAIGKTTGAFQDYRITSNLPLHIEAALLSFYYQCYIAGKRLVFEKEIDSDFEIITIIERG